MSLQDQSLRIEQPNEGRHFNVMGASITYKATADETVGAYALAIETTPPHGGFPLNVHHREDEAMYILEGQYDIQCRDHVIRATPGVFFFLPREKQNRYQDSGG